VVDRNKTRSKFITSEKSIITMTTSSTTPPSKEKKKEDTKVKGKVDPNALVIFENEKI
jgi:hypothetical protein